MKVAIPCILLGPKQYVRSVCIETRFADSLIVIPACLAGPAISISCTLFAFPGLFRDRTLIVVVLADNRYRKLDGNSQEIITINI
jgi:hypothetical protein